MPRVDNKGSIPAMEATAAVVCDICGLELAKADAASAAHPLVNQSKLAQRHPCTRASLARSSRIVAPDRGDGGVGDLARGGGAAEVGRVQRRIGGDLLDRPHQAVRGGFFAEV